MNTENFDKLIAHLETLKARGLEHKFNMKHWISYPVRAVDVIVTSYTIESMRLFASHHGVRDIKVDPFECKTVACLAGHAAMIGGAREDDDIEEFAGEWLGLSRDAADHLFRGWWAMDKELSTVTLDEAIDRLRVTRATELEYD